jgi:flagellar hook-length control protein FliK
MLNKEIQRENNTASKADFTQKNQSNKLSKAPASKESTSLKENTNNSQEVNKEQTDLLIEKSEDEMNIPSDLLSYVQDISQLLNPLATPVTTANAAPTQNIVIQNAPNTAASSVVESKNSITLGKSNLESTVSINAELLNETLVSPKEIANSSLKSEQPIQAFAANLKTASAQVNDVEKNQLSFSSTSNQLSNSELSASTTEAIITQSQKNSPPIDSALSTAAIPTSSTIPAPTISLPTKSINGASNTDSTEQLSSTNNLNLADANGVLSKSNKNLKSIALTNSDLLTTPTTRVNEVDKNQFSSFISSNQLSNSELSASTTEALITQSQKNSPPIDPALSTAAIPTSSTIPAPTISLPTKTINGASNTDGTEQLSSTNNLNLADANGVLSESKTSVKDVANSLESKVDTEPKLNNERTLHGTSFSSQVKEASSELTSKELSIKENSGAANNPVQISAATNAADLRPVSPTPMQSHIPQSVHSNEWNQALGNKIIWMAQDGIQTAKLDLNPPDLGPLQIVLNISNENIDARFVSSHMEVRTAVEAAMPKLKEMMENTGLSLSGFNVSSQSTPQEQSQQQQEARQRLSQLDGGRLDKNSNNIISDSTSTKPKTRLSLGQVDTFV